MWGGLGLVGVGGEILGCCHDFLDLRSYAVSIRKSIGFNSVFNG